MKIKVSELVFIEIEAPRSVTERVSSVLALWAKEGDVEHAITRFHGFKVLEHNHKYYALEHFFFLRELQRRRPDEYVKIIKVKSQQKNKAGLIEEIVGWICSAGLVGIEALDAVALELSNPSILKSYTVTKWSEAFGCHRSTIHNRIKNLNEVKSYENKDLKPIEKNLLIGETPGFPKNKRGQL